MCTPPPQADLTQDDLTVDPLPGDLTAFIKRMCASSPAPDAPSRQLAIGEWTIVTCYEPEFKDPSVPPKLRYGFATLNAENRTIVVGTAEFLRMHTPEGEAADTDANVSRWERSMDSLTQKVLNDRRDDFQTSSRRQRIGAGLFARGGDPELEEISGLKTGVFRAHEVDEIFEALANMGRLVSPPL